MWLQSYFKQLAATFTNPRQYVQFLNQPFLNSLAFFVFSFALLSLIWSIHFLIFTMPKFQVVLESSSQEFVEHFPEDAEFSYINGELTSNIQQPVPLYYPSSIPKRQRPTQLLGLYDPNLTNIEENPPSQSSLVVANTKNLYVSNLQGDWIEAPLSEVYGQNVELISSQTVANQAPALVSEISRIIQDGAWTLPIWHFVVLTPIRFGVILVDSFLGYLLFILLGSQIPWRKVLQLFLHIAVPAQTIHLAASIVAPTSELQMFSLTSWVLFLVLVLVLKDVRQIKPLAKGDHHRSG